MGRKKVVMNGRKVVTGRKKVVTGRKKVVTGGKKVVTGGKKVVMIPLGHRTFAIVELAVLDKTSKYSIPRSQRDATFSGGGNLT